MSTSKKQTDANRENAQKSTGPVTEEGKKNSSQNAVKHGFNATSIILNSPSIKEDQSEYDTLVASLIEELKPQGPMQTHLVYKIANCQWRYRRLINAETAIISSQTTPNFSYIQSESQLVNRIQDDVRAHFNNPSWALSRSIPKNEDAVILTRYEQRLTRELNQAYKMLRDLQTTCQNLENKKFQNEPISPKTSPSQSVTDEEFSARKTLKRICDAYDKVAPYLPSKNGNRIDRLVSLLTEDAPFA